MKLLFILPLVFLLTSVVGRPAVSKPSEEIDFKASKVAYIGRPPPIDMAALTKLNPRWQFLPLPAKYFEQLYVTPAPISQQEARAIAMRMNRAFKGKNPFAGGPVLAKDQDVTWWHQCPTDENKCYGVPIVKQKIVYEDDNDDYDSNED